MGVIPCYRVGLRLDPGSLVAHRILIEACPVPQQESWSPEKLKICLNFASGGGKFVCCSGKRAPLIGGCLDIQGRQRSDRYLEIYCLWEKWLSCLEPLRGSGRYAHGTEDVRRASELSEGYHCCCIRKKMQHGHHLVHVHLYLHRRSCLFFGSTTLSVNLRCQQLDSRCRSGEWRALRAIRYILSHQHRLSDSSTTRIC